MRLVSSQHCCSCCIRQGVRNGGSEKASSGCQSERNRNLRLTKVDVTCLGSSPQNGVNSTVQASARRLAEGLYV